MMLIMMMLLMQAWMIFLQIFEVWI